MIAQGIKIGFIGCGWIVENAHIPAFLKLDNVEILSIYDVELSRANRISNLFNIKNAFNDINEFFDSGVNAVVVATPNFTHVDYSLQALRRGIHVLCEKPIAFYTQEVKQIIETAQSKGALFVPGFVNRFRHDILKLREIILSHELGEIKSIDAGWLRRAGVPRPGTWFTSKEHSGGGVLIDLGSHITDICLMLINDATTLKSTKLTTSKYQKDEATSAAQWFLGNYSNDFQVNVEDTAYARLEYGANVFVDIKLSWSCPIQGDCTYFIIKGTKSSIKLKTLFGFSTDRLWKEDQLIRIDNNNKSVIEYLDRGVNNTRNAFYNMAEYFVKAVNGHNMDFLNHEDALKSVRLIEQLYENEINDQSIINSIYLEDYECE